MKTQIQFIGKSTFVFVGFSFFLVVASILFFFTFGLNYGIDFTGGTEVQVKMAQEVSVPQIKADLKEMGIKKNRVYQFNETEVVIGIPPASTKEVQKIKISENTNKKDLESSKEVTKLREGLTVKYPDSELLKVDYVGSQVGSELKSDGFWALIYSLVLILIYIAFRFNFTYAPSAVICLFHDVFLVVGIYMALGKEFNLQTLAALLTIIGYSLNDTIITFDRIRENLGEKTHSHSELKNLINLSINSMLSRTILTSLTTLIFVLALYIFTTGVMKDIAFTLAVGVVIGTYSSIYIASPLVYLFSISSKSS